MSAVFRVVDKPAQQILMDTLAQKNAELTAIRADQASDAVKAQATHDPVYRQFGDLYAEGSLVPFFESHAPAPLLSESPTQYRKRSLERLKPFSETYRNEDLAAYHDAALAVAEQKILSDARQVAAKPTPASLPADGTMLVRVRKDDLGIGRYKERYSAHPGKIWDQFKRPTQLVKAWKNPRLGTTQDAFPDYVLSKAR